MWRRLHSLKGLKGKGKREDKEMTDSNNNPVLIRLKIGRYEYEITENDKLMDNGACVQFLTKRGPRGKWGHKSLVLTKKALREIESFRRVEHHHELGEWVKVFSLRRHEGGDKK